MKISIGMDLQPGPWGGGNQFGHSLVEYLRSKGVEVSFDLISADIDLIFLTEPRSHLRSSAYSDRDIAKYLLLKNREAVVLHRINECDERKGTTNVNRRLKNANQCADHTIFISTWLKELFFSQGLKSPGYQIILNGANQRIFNSNGYLRWDGKEKLRIVTHHWGGGYLKGFDIYGRIDAMLTESKWRDRIEFTYIGNIPEGFTFKNTTWTPPTSGVKLAETIRKHHIYISASQNEPAGMHHIEGALCGLPLLYRESGALPEYCNQFGISFHENNFEQKILEMVDLYDYYVDRMSDYPHTAERMCENYYGLFLDLLDRRKEILRQRRFNYWIMILGKVVKPRLHLKQILRIFQNWYDGLGSCR